MAASPKIGYTLPELNGSNQITIVNLALISIETLGPHIIVEDDSLTAAPSGVEGEVYKINGAGTGDWASHSEFALYYNGAWVFKDTVEDGQMYYDKTTQAFFIRQSAAYVSQTTP